MVPHIIPPVDENELYPNNITTPPIEDPTHVGPALTEDDEETMHKPLQPKNCDTLEHLEDNLTIPDDDPSEINTV